MIHRFMQWLVAPSYRPFKATVLVGMVLVLVFALFSAVNLFNDVQDPRSEQFVAWMQGDEPTRQALITTQREACPGAPFILPADGFIGLLYGDPRGPYSTAAPHQGIDIFSDTEPGLTPVYAAYDGYITRQTDWRSSLIQRIPDDPLNPGNQLWLYYTHMADKAGNDFIEDIFSPGTSELFVEQGTLLGYTGDYNGASARSIWVHLHFSIVKDDGNGRFLNELDFQNTLDPSPYLGMATNYACAPMTVGCSENPVCQ